MFVLQYPKNALIGIDQLVNTILAGDPDETISSRVGKWASSGGEDAEAFERLIDSVLGEGHCKDSIEPDEGVRTGDKP